MARTDAQERSETLARLAKDMYGSPDQRLVGVLALLALEVYDLTLAVYSLDKR